MYPASLKGVILFKNNLFMFIITGDYSFRTLCARQYLPVYNRCYAY